VKVIRHQAVDGAKEAFPNRSVEEQFTEAGVKSVRQPAAGTLLHGHFPMDDGVSLVVMPRQPWQMLSERESHGGSVSHTGAWWEKN
jgi:hypothetical protein